MGLPAIQFNEPCRMISSDWRRGSFCIDDPNALAYQEILLSGKIRGEPARAGGEEETQEVLHHNERRRTFIMEQMRESHSEERAPAGDSILILTFHALEESGDVLSYPPSLLGEAVQRLLDAGLEAVTVGAGADRLRSGSQAGRRLFAISFDDGYRSVWDEGYPVLDRLGVPATVFINGRPGVSGALPPMEGRARMTAAHIHAWAAAGGEVGAHSVTHPDFTLLNEDAMHQEMADSKAGLEEITGTTVTSFAYPFGFHDTRVRAAARRHFRCACGTEQGIAGPGSDLFALARIEMADFRDRARLRLLSGPWLRVWLALLAGPRWLSQRRIRRRVHARAVAPR